MSALERPSDPCTCAHRRDMHGRFSHLCLCPGCECTYFFDARERDRIRKERSK